MFLLDVVSPVERMFEKASPVAITVAAVAVAVIIILVVKNKKK